jgi:bifunctional non-homologous end joining protein LigD
VAFQRKKPEKIGIKAPLPGFIEPALASKVERVPEGARWIHEIKFDGYRVQIHISTTMSKSIPAAAMTGPNAFARSPTMFGT